MKDIISLNGIWKFTPTYDQKPNNNHNVIETSMPMYAISKLNRIHWEDVQVPGVWQRYAEKYSVYEGVCWFYREFELNNVDENSITNLIFKGVNYRAVVYVNDCLVGEHESAYTEFSFDISKYVKKGRNSIAVEVDNRPIIVKWPNDWGYGVYGGIHRDVFLEVFNGDSITDISFYPDYSADTQKGILNLSGKLNCDCDFISVDLSGEKINVKCENRQFDTKLEFCGITPWLPENPKLYDLKISLNGENYTDCKVGFRNVCCKEKSLYLNGEKAHLNGACYVYDSPVFGLVMDKEQLKQDLSKMKEANVNAIRTHYPMSDDFYRLCDEMGFAVWIEPNIYCSKPSPDVKGTIFSQEEFIDVAVSMTEEMVKGAKPFASVIIYGIGNECSTHHPEALPFFEKIAKTMRDNDHTRILGYASLYNWVGNIAHLVDIMGINSYYGWYGTFPTFDSDMETDNLDYTAICNRDTKKLHDLLNEVENLIPEDMPILLTEFGADSVPDFHSANKEFWSEEYHALTVKNYIEESKKHSNVVGTFVFAFTDYSDPSKPLNGYWNGLNLKGMLTYDRKYKLPYFALKEAYSKTEED